MKKLFLYLMALFYCGMGAIHIVSPDNYISMMPMWLPLKTFLIYLSGFIEIILSVLLLSVKTLQISSRLIMLMLFVFLLLIHIPQSIGFYTSGDPHFGASLIRIPIQFILIFWAWIYAKPKKVEILHKVE